MELNGDKTQSNLKGLTFLEKITIIVLLIFTLISVYLFTRGVTKLTFELNEQTAHVGDTIGGITAPFIGLLSALLVYLSFKKQTEANSIITDQFNLQFNLSSIEKSIDRAENNLNKLGVGKFENQFIGLKYVEAVTKWLELTNLNSESDSPSIKSAKGFLKSSFDEVNHINKIMKTVNVGMNFLNGRNISDAQKAYYIDIIDIIIPIKILTNLRYQIEMIDIKIEKAQKEHEKNKELGNINKSDFYWELIKVKGQIDIYNETRLELLAQIRNKD